MPPPGSIKELLAEKKDFETIAVLISPIMFLQEHFPDDVRAMLKEYDIPANKLAFEINSFPLMACPFFILAGEIMGAAKLSDRILDFCRACVSWMKGGLGAVCVLANMIFAAISGSGAASISAIGSLTTPQLKKTGYNRGFVAALIAGGGALGPIIPPSMNMIN